MDKSLRMKIENLTKLSTVVEEQKSPEKLEKLISKVRVHLRCSNPGTFVALLNSLTLYKKQVDDISKLAPNFDPVNGVEANGFRSFLKISEILTDKVDEEILKLEHEGDLYLFLFHFLQFPFAGFEPIPKRLIECFYFIPISNFANYYLDAVLNYASYLYLLMGHSRPLFCLFSLQFQYKLKKA